MTEEKVNTNYHELFINLQAQQLYDKLHGNYMLKEKTCRCGFLRPFGSKRAELERDSLGGNKTKQIFYSLII